MKKIAWILVFALLIQLIPVNAGTLKVQASETAGQSIADSTVITSEHIPDATLLNCIKNEVGKTPEETVTYGDIKNISSLSYPVSVTKELGWNPIESLEGIDILTDLYSLTVTGHNITDLTPLESVESLSSLWADDNKISVMPDFSDRSMSAFYVARNHLSLATLQSNLPSYFTSSAEDYYTLQLPETPEVLASDNYYEVCDKNGNSYYPLTISTSDLRCERTYTVTSITVDGADVTGQFQVNIKEDWQAPEGMKVTVYANGGEFLTTMDTHNVKVELVDEYNETYSLGTNFVLEPMQDAYVMESEQTEYISCTGVQQTGILVTDKTFMTKDSTVTVEKVDLVDQEGTSYGSTYANSYTPYGLYDYRYTDWDVMYDCSNTLQSLAGSSDNVCQTQSSSTRIGIYRELPEGLYDLVFTLSDGTTYTYKNAYEAVTRPIVYGVLDTDDALDYNLMYTDQTSDYVSIYVYGWNLTKDTVKPIFYNDSDEVISGDVKAVETDKWGAYFRIEKENPDSEDWQIELPSSKTSGDKKFNVKIETEEELCDKNVYITRREIFYQYYDQRDKTYTVYFAQNADLDMTVSPTLMFQTYDYNVQDYTSFITAEGGTFIEEINPLTGQTEIKAVFTLTDEQIALAREKEYDFYYYAVDYVNASGEARTFRSEYFAQYAQGGYEVKDVSESGRVSGYNQTYFYLPYWIGNVYSIEGNGENSYYLTEDDVATLSDGKFTYAEYRKDEETGAVEEKYNYRRDYYFWTVGEPIEAPVGTPELTVTKQDEIWHFSWTQVEGATYYDLMFRYGESAIPPFYRLETERDIHPDELIEMFRMYFEECYLNPDESKMEVYVRPVAYKDGEFAYGTDSNVFTVAELKSILEGGYTHTHTETVKVTKAQYGKNGSEATVCSSCSEPIKSTTIYAPKTVTVSDLTYNGKNQTPTVVVKDSQGKVIAASNYTVSTVKNVGSNKVTITFKSSSKYYAGTMTATAQVNPKATKLSKVTGKKKSIVVKWKKMATQTKGYQIQYSTDKNFKKKVKTVTIKKNKTTSKTIKKLKAKKKYYVRIRTYNGKCYSAWSKAKSAKTK